VRDLTNTVAVVTGGGSGIGRALALSLAEAGSHVAVADIDRTAARDVAVEVEARGVRALAVEVDVADKASVDDLELAVTASLGPTDVLCNNAGVFVMGPITEMVVEDWAWIISVNVMGVVHGVHAFLPRMLERGSGHILNTASVAGLGGGRGSGVYAMSKCAVLSITESLHAELAPKGIGVTALCPGNVSSRILGAQRNRPSQFGRLADEPFGRDLVDFGMEPMHAARRAVDAIRDDELYVFAYPAEWGRAIGPTTERRFTAILDAIAAGAVASVSEVDVSEEARS
jgi:NAD(P)-dependent dehydrogenase (short-subunit alcohol dehydrogenase family)